MKLVAGPGIEPGTGAYETPEIPFLYPAIEFIVGGTALCLKLLLVLRALSRAVAKLKPLS
jgi:hypothetical protein